jgi:hypothetical protein
VVVRAACDRLLALISKVIYGVSSMAFYKIRIGWGGISLEASDGGGSSSAFDSTVDIATLPVTGVRRAMLVWDRVTSGITEDAATCSLAFMNYTSGAPDDTWNDADYASIEGGIATWWAAIKSQVHPSHTLREVRWYKIDGAVGDHPVLRVAAIGGAGTSGTSLLPLQVALSVTLKTPLRKRWGRIYLPGFSQTPNTTIGRPDGTFAQLIADSTATMLGSGKTQGIVPVVYSPTLRAVHSVTKVTVDDIWDVIRRRRPGLASQRHDAIPNYA